MQSIEEFMQSYFAARAQLLCAHEDMRDEIDSSLYTEAYCTERRARRDRSTGQENDAPPSVIKVVNQGLSTEVVSSEPEGKNRKQYRYTLISTECGWQIAKILEECEFCRNPVWGIAHQCENGWALIDYCR